MTIKKLLTLALLLTLTMGVAAQSIDGTWKADSTTRKILKLDGKEDLEADFFFVFDGNKIEIRFDMSVTEAKVGTMDIRCSMPGTFLRKDNTLTNLNLEKDQCKVILLPTSKFEDSIESDPATKKLVITLINNMIEKELAGSMKEDLNEMAEAFAESEITVKSVSSQKLLLSAEEMTLSFDKVTQ